jgi:hypothetical protein
MLTIKTTERFDDVGDAGAHAHVDYAYHGFNYQISDGTSTFVARTYDDEPGSVAVVGPASARSSALVRDLIALLVARLNASRVLFYSEERGGYLPVNLESLDFEG